MMVQKMSLLFETPLFFSFFGTAEEKKQHQQIHFKRLAVGRRHPFSSRTRLHSHPHPARFWPLVCACAVAARQSILSNLISMRVDDF